MSNYNPESDWTEAEKWAFIQLREGMPANFNQRCGIDLDPKVSEDKSGAWGKRELRPEFMRTLLLDKHYRDGFSKSKLEIIGAWFSGGIDIEDGHISLEWALTGCRIQGQAILRGLRNLNSISFVDSVFTGPLHFTDATIDGCLHLTGTIFEDYVDLSRTEIGHDLDILSSKNRGVEFTELWLRRVHVAGVVQLDNCKFTELDMTQIEIGHDLTMKDILIGALGIGSREARIGGKFLINGGDFHGSIDIGRIKVSQNIDMMGLKFCEKLLQISLEDADIGGHMVVADVRNEPVRLEMRFAAIHHDLRIDRSDFDSLDFLGVHIDGSCVLKDSRCFGQADMRNLEIGRDIEVIRHLSENDIDTAILDMKLSKVGRDLKLKECQCDELDLTQVEVGHDLSIHQVNVKFRIFLLKSVIRGELSLKGDQAGGGKVCCKGPVDLGDVDVGRNIYITHAEFLMTNISKAKIQGEITLDRLTCRDRLNMSDIDVKKSVSLKRMEESGEVILDRATIGERVDISLSGGKNALSMEGIEVGRDVNLNIASGRNISLRMAELKGDITFTAVSI